MSVKTIRIPPIYKPVFHDTPLLLDNGITTAVDAALSTLQNDDRNKTPLEPMTYREAIRAIHQMAAKPKPELKAIWHNDALIQRGANIDCSQSLLAKAKEHLGIDDDGAVLYHGTTAENAVSIANQAERNDGLIEKRLCLNGSSHRSGIYGTSCPIATIAYTGAERVVKFISHRLHFDELRGTTTYDHQQDVMPLVVYEVANHAERCAHRPLSIFTRAKLALELTTGRKTPHDVDKEIRAATKNLFQ